MAEDGGLVGSVRQYADHLRQEGLVDEAIVDRRLETVVDEKSAYRALEALKEAHATALAKVNTKVRLEASSKALKDAGWHSMVFGGLCLVAGIGASVFVEIGLRLFAVRAPAISGIAGLGLGVYGLYLFLKGLSQYRSG